MRDLIAISGKQYAGKDVLADLLLEALPGFRKTPLAAGIKAEFAALYGLTPHDIEANKANYRTGLIALGQRRRLQDPDHWLTRTMQHPGPKIISDMRLLREHAYFREEGAFLIRLETDRELRGKRGSLVAEADATECELDTVTDWDAILTNNGSVDDLKAQLAPLLAKINES